MTAAGTRPAPIRTDSSNAFAHNTMKVRIPAIVREVQQLNPDYPPQIMAALDRLHDEVAGDAPIRPLTLPAPDADDWASAYAPHDGETWHNTQWWFAEVYFYRLLMETVRWFETRRDPFMPKKRAELASPALWKMLNTALELHGAPPEERLPAAILQALWGNRIDLSFAPALAHGHDWTHDDLLVADHEAAATHVLRERGTVHIVHDNTGTELAADLALADALLEAGCARLVCHLKWHPTFVSDATVKDMLHIVDLMRGGEHGDAVQSLGDRLYTAFLDGRLRYAPDAFWNSIHFLDNLPPRLTQLFDGATLVVIKGDANYRRAVGDIIWPYDTPLATALGGFRHPTLLLRTLKSDTLAAMPRAIGEQLDAADAAWRVNGRRGVIQYSGLRDED
jgi:uncharacterized protein with ATP-grasp and redox domains